VLGEQIDHHVKEEEDELFPEVRKADIDTKALGEQLAARKQELMKDYKADGVPEPELKTMDEVSI
jgi:restriction endonuclease S subunit